MLSALGGRYEVVGESEVVIDLDQQVREPDNTHVLGQPSLQVAQPCLRLGVQCLGVVGGKMPAVLIHSGVSVVWGRLEKKVVSCVQSFRRMIVNILGVGGQAGPLEEGLPKWLPSFLGEEVILEPAEPFAMLYRQVPRSQIVLKLQQQGTLPGLPVRLAVDNDKRQESLGNEVHRDVLGEFPLLVDVHLLENANGFQARNFVVAGVWDELQGAK